MADRFSGLANLETEDTIKALSLVLYGSSRSAQAQEFRLGFIDGLEDHQIGRWREARSISPRAIAYNLAAAKREAHW